MIRSEWWILVGAVLIMGGLFLYFFWATGG